MIKFWVEDIDCDKKPYGRKERKKEYEKEQEIITEEEKLDEIIHNIWQSKKEIEGDEDDNSDFDVDEKIPEPPTSAEMRHYLTRLESGLEWFDSSDMNPLRTLKENIRSEMQTKHLAKQATLNKFFIQ
ncbi:Hypothetical predicted protein [Octopus vulgaris]|uniref:Uncharacterized protein n=1 Tax=Octopus vulgaris TaxID=6645 RepID=A0AA36FBA2_OCTVU|nr:Hypothetical predicted protein [Octopus vulgaris]